MVTKGPQGDGEAIAPGWSSFWRSPDVCVSADFTGEHR